MPALSHTVTDRLLNAVEKTAELVDNGMSPNDAIVKVATTTGLRRDELPMVVRAFNTGRTSRQRMAGADAHEKAAAFTLADIDQVCAALFPVLTKKAAAGFANSTDVAPEYYQGPQTLLRMKRAAALTTLQFPAIDQSTAATPPSDRAVRMAFTAVQQTAKRAAEESRRQVSEAQDTAAVAIADLVAYFERGDALPLHAVKAAAVTLHGDFAELLFAKLAVAAPTLTKLAAHCGREYIKAEHLDCTLAPFPQIAAVREAMQAVAVKTAAFAKAAAGYQQQVEQHLRPLVGSRGCSILDGESLQKQAFGIDIPDPLKALGTYSLISRTVEPMMDKLKGPDSSARLEKTLGALNDPQHEQRLRAINTQAMLTELMGSDPVISQHPPQEVLRTFNEISQLTPSITDQTMLLRTAMRQKLEQGGLDTHQQGQLLGFDSQLRQQLQPSGGGQHAKPVAH